MLPKADRPSDQSIGSVISSLDEAESVIGGAEAVICGLEGCLLHGSVPYEDAQRLSQRLGKRLWIVSNNSSDTADSLSRKLFQAGIDVAPMRILLAGETTLRFLSATNPTGLIRLHCGPILRARATSLGLFEGNNKIDSVVLCRDGVIKTETLLEIAQDLRSGASFWVSNTDLAHRGPDGTVQPETGALLAAVMAYLPGLEVRTLGKPRDHMLREVLRRSGMAPGKCVFIGSNPATDGQAARSARMRFYHLLRRAGTEAPT